LPFCANCVKELTVGGSFCPDCGSPAAVQVEGSATRELEAYREVNVWAAVALSVVFPGLGQIYLGEKRRGAFFLAAGLIGLGTVVIQAGIIIYPVLLLVNSFDVRRSARRVNGENGGLAQVSPENGPRPLGGNRPSKVARDGKANSCAIGGHPRRRIPAW
jgi:TM2 domain-containing membrane protein YozV